MSAKIRTHDPIQLGFEYDDTDKLSAWEKRMEEKALRQRWPITEAKRVKIVERLLEVVESPATEDFNLVAAAKALISADRLNLEERKMDLSQAMPNPHDGDFVIDITPTDADRPS